jgi:glucose-1-phosphate adenylyltransferase
VCLAPVNGKRYRGTADAVFRNAELLESHDTEFVLVLSGDHIYQMDYRDLLRYHVETNADLTIATVEHPVHEASHFGVIEIDKTFRVTSFEEKPIDPRPLPSDPSLALVSMGVYVFKKRVLTESLRHLCESGIGYDFGHDIIPALIGSGRTFAFDFRDNVGDAPHYWRDIGTIDAYHQANMDLIQPGASFDPHAPSFSDSRPTIYPRHQSGRPVTTNFALIDTDACVNRSVLSPGVELERGVVVDESVLMPGVRVGKGARLRRTIVEKGVHIPADFRVGFDLEIDRKIHTVTESGVVVLSEIPRDLTCNVLHFVVRREKTVIAKKSEAETRPLWQNRIEEPDPTKLNPSVLFVDDDEEICTLMRTYLERQHISVVTAANGLEALRIFQKNTDIPLVVTDQHMPLMKGDVLIRELHKINENIKLIIATADTGGDKWHTAHEDAVSLFKPYTPDQLAHAVRQLLGVSGA